MAVVASVIAAVVLSGFFAVSGFGAAMLAIAGITAIAAGLAANLILESAGLHEGPQWVLLASVLFFAATAIASGAEIMSLPMREAAITLLGIGLNLVLGIVAYSAGLFAESLLD